MKRKIRFILGGILAVVIVAASACGKENKKSEQISVGYFNNVTHAQALLMKSEKSLEKSVGDGVNVKWTAFNAGPAEVEALFAGDIDIGYIGPVPALSANVKSQGDVQILAGATKGGAVLIQRKGAGIRSVENLAGKSVAIPQIGNTQHLSLLKLLKDNNLKPVTEGGNVTVNAVANADVANIMQRGDIDAALVPEPWGATLLEQGAEMVLDYQQIYLEGQYDVAVVVVRKEFMESNPELVAKFLEEHNRITGQINKDPENAQTKVNEELNNATGKALSEKIMKEAFGRIIFQTDYNPDAIEAFAQLSKEHGFIREIPEQDFLYAKIEKGEEK